MGPVYGFDKATTSRLHHTAKLPELQIEQLPQRSYYVVASTSMMPAAWYTLRRSSGDQLEDLGGRSAGWLSPGHPAGVIVPRRSTRDERSGLRQGTHQLGRIVGDPHCLNR